MILLIKFFWFALLLIIVTFKKLTLRPRFNKPACEKKLLDLVITKFGLTLKWIHMTEGLHVIVHVYINCWNIVPYLILWSHQELVVQQRKICDISNSQNQQWANLQYHFARNLIKCIICIFQIIPGKIQKNSKFNR